MEGREVESSRRFYTSSVRSMIALPCRFEAAAHKSQRHSYCTAGFGKEEKGALHGSIPQKFPESGSTCEAAWMFSGDSHM